MNENGQRCAQSLLIERFNKSFFYSILRMTNPTQLHLTPIDKKKIPNRLPPALAARAAYMTEIKPEEEETRERKKKREKKADFAMRRNRYES